MNHQIMELGVWLGVAALALILAYVLLWRARRLLSRFQQDGGAPEGKLSSSAVANQTNPIIAS